MKKALYRKRICAEKEKLTPEKVFHTPQYRDLLTSIGHEITGGKLTTLRLYDDKNSGIAGWNQGETVAVNLGNQITSSFLTLELKSDSLIGILGHECGHYRYTDSALRKRYAEHMLNGSWYPKEPVPENAQEKEALDAMNVYFERKDKAILSIFLQTASYLSNLLNDMYIEEKMCALFPGSIRRGILMNRDRNVEWLPTLREMLETEKDRLSILMNLCAQYALSSRVNAWDGADYELIDTLKLLTPVIDEAGKAADGMERYLATNHILLMIFIYYFKNFLPISDIKTILGPLTDKYFHKDADLNLEAIYTTLFSKEDTFVQEVLENVMKQFHMSADLFPDAPKADQASLREFTFICMLSLDIYLKKQLIEAILDKK